MLGKPGPRIQQANDIPWEHPVCHFLPQLVPLVSFLKPRSICASVEQHYARCVPIPSHLELAMILAHFWILINQLTIFPTTDNERATTENIKPKPLD